MVSSVYLVVEKELKLNISRNVAIFNTEEKAKKYIENVGKNGDYFECGITKFIVSHWE